MSKRFKLAIIPAILGALILAGAVLAQQRHRHGSQPQSGDNPPAQMCMGGGQGSGCCGNMAGQKQGGACCGGMMGGQRGQGMRADMPVIHSLLEQNGKITRRTKEVPGGVETWTESDDPEIVQLIQQHVASMRDRIKEGRPIRQGDPLFRAIFENYKLIEMTVENTPKGVHVIETSKDPRVADLIRAHGSAVDGFVKEGMPGMMKMHPVPESYKRP